MKIQPNKSNNEKNINTYTTHYINRALRSSIDFEYEKTIAQANGIVDTRVETVFLMARAEHAPISSTVVRDLIRHGGDASAFLPEGIDLSRYPKNQ